MMEEGVTTLLPHYNDTLMSIDDHCHNYTNATVQIYFYTNVVALLVIITLGIYTVVAGRIFVRVTAGIFCSCKHYCWNYCECVMGTLAGFAKALPLVLLYCRYTIGNTVGFSQVLLYRYYCTAGITTDVIASIL